MKKIIRIVDLFAGIGGLRQGVQRGLKDSGYDSKIVFTSEIKKPAIKTLNANWHMDEVSGDITKIDEADIPEHDLLIGGFPCQAFSMAGKRLGFEDKTKGTLFFDVARILRHHKPEQFILENVEGLVRHDPDPADKNSPIGRTLKIILGTLEELGYKVSWRLLEATDFGIPQTRKRIFIVGSLKSEPDLASIVTYKSLPLSSILEHGIKENDPRITKFSDSLKKEYKDLHFVENKIFRDWRGGDTHLHSWNVNLKGTTTKKERNLLESMRTNSKKVQWRGIAPAGGEGHLLTAEQIYTFYQEISLDELKIALEKLTLQNYLKNENGRYRISSGRLTAPISYIYGPNNYSGTLVATDADHMGVIDDGKLRRYTETEVKRLFGFADNFIIPETVTKREMFDLFGNSVVIPVAQAVAQTLKF